MPQENENLGREGETLQGVQRICSSDSTRTDNTLASLIPPSIKPYYIDEYACIIHADCRDVLPKLAGITAVVTDPPYELGFMGNSWDSKGVSFQKETWEAIRRPCLPGAPLLSFGGTRTYHRIACAVEDAGWELKDCIMWVYGTGFPKSLDISKAIDKMKGAQRVVTGTYVARGFSEVSPTGDGRNQWAAGEVIDKIGLRTSPATPEGQLWSGYGTALKPAYEPIVLAMNPLDGTFAENALKHGVAGLNIDGCRVPFPAGDDALEKGLARAETPRADIRGGGFHTGVDWAERRAVVQSGMTSKGRFPSDFVHDGSEKVLELFPEAGGGYGTENRAESKGHYGNYSGTTKGKIVGYGDGHTSTARFFYVAKASKRERGEGNGHPTVKPLALMEYLCKLVKMPEYNIILDPFLGSGTTCFAAKQLGRKSIGIEIEERYCEIAARRLSQGVLELK